MAATIGNFLHSEFDRACFDNGATSRYGAVIRNGNGEVMATLSAKGGAVRDSEEVEVMACRTIWVNKDRMIIIAP